MKIAVIGAGSVGGTLGRRWAELGHAVVFGVRDIADPDAKALIDKIKDEACLRMPMLSCSRPPMRRIPPRSPRPAIFPARF
jgi:predicted dinucleotide-binding enzyme